MGISPYYRGNDCNFWALNDNNPHLVGSTIHLLSKGLDNGFHVVRITNLDQSLDPARLEYQIYNENDLNSREHSGFVDDPDVYGVVGSNVSFHDRDAGYSVTQGDYFVIDSETIGSKDGTWSMKLIDQSSNRLLFDVKLILIED